MDDYYTNNKDTQFKGKSLPVIGAYSLNHFMSKYWTDFEELLLVLESSDCWPPAEGKSNVTQIF